MCRVAWVGYKKGFIIPRVLTEVKVVMGAVTVKEQEVIIISGAGNFRSGLSIKFLQPV